RRRARRAAPRQCHNADERCQARRDAEIRSPSVVTVAQVRTLVHPVVAPVGDRFRYLDHYVYDALLEAIVQGRLALGTRLVLDDLADQLKVSRTPIRDALRRLASEGLVHRSGRQ